MDVEVLDLGINEQLSQPKRSKTRGTALAGVCLSIVVGLQLIPSADPPAFDETVVPEPTDPQVQPLVISSPFQWVQVGGLDRFETVTKPVTTDSGYLAVGNPAGISGAASVVVSIRGYVMPGTARSRPACATSCSLHQCGVLLQRSCGEHTLRAKLSDRAPVPEVVCKVRVRPFRLSATR